MMAPRKLLQDPAWLLATTLEERLEVASSGSLPPLTDKGWELAERRLARWRSQAPFDEGSHFERRLELDGLSPERFLGLLGCGPEEWAVIFSAPPAWVATLAEILAPPREPTVMAEVESWAEGLAERADRALIGFVQPFLEWAWRKVAEAAREMGPDGGPWEPRQLPGILLADLPLRLLMRIDRTLTLELQVARLEERLVGETPEERFGGFVEEICQPERRLALLREYPVLARQLTLAVENWVLGALDFARALAADWPALVDTLALGEDPGTLERVEGRAGDPHRGSKTVKIVHLSSGSSLVFKPRSLATDVHFGELGGIRRRPSLPLARRGAPFLPSPRRMAGGSLRSRRHGFPL